MNSSDIALVQQSWKQVQPIADTAAGLFYQRLFELDPNLRDLFSRDLAEQGRRLMAMIDFVIGRLDDLAKVTPQIEALGRRHVSYGVTDDHYDTVGAALIWTLEQGLGEAFGTAMRQAWIEVYSALAQTMRGAVPHAA